MRLASRVRPWRISATTTPVSARGSTSAIIRRNSSPARPGKELKKSIHTELSTRIIYRAWHRSCELITGQRSSLFDGEFVAGDGVVAGAGVQDRRGEFRLVGGIGKVLGFQAEGGAFGIGEPALANSCAVEEIAGIKLDARLGGPDFHDAAGSGLEDARGESFAPVHGHAQDEVVVVAAAEL